MDHRTFLALIGTASLAAVEDSPPSRAAAADSTRVPGFAYSHFAYSDRG